MLFCNRTNRNGVDILEPTVILVAFNDPNLNLPNNMVKHVSNALIKVENSSNWV